MPHWLIELFQRYGYAVVMVGVGAESAGLPVPGETALLAAGFFAHEGALQLGWVIVLGAIAAIIGDNVGYAVGAKWGRRLVESHRVPWLNPRRLGRLDRFFESHGPKAVFFARFVMGARVLGAFFAGMSALRWRTFLLWNVLGAVTWAAAAGVVGFLFGHSWAVLEKWTRGVGFVALGAVIVAVAIVVWRRRGGFPGGRSNGRTKDQTTV